MKALALAQQLIRLASMHGDIECDIYIDFPNGETTQASITSAYEEEGKIEIYGGCK